MEGLARSDVEFNCPFCGRRVGAGFTSDGDPVVMHALPLCKTFDENDTLKYMTMAREVMERAKKS